MGESVLLLQVAYLVICVAAIVTFAVQVVKGRRRS